MGMDFNVDVNVTTNGKSEVDALEKQIQKLQSTKINLNVTLGGNGLDLSKIFSGIEKQAESVGKSISNSFQKGFKTVKFNGNVDDFYKQYLDQQKKNAKEAENISKQYSISQKEAVKAVNAKNHAVVKANNDAKKQAEEIAKIQKNVLNDTYAAKSSSLTSRLSPYTNQDTKLLKQAREQAKLYDDTLQNLKKHFDTNDSFKLNDDEVVKSFETMNNAAKKFDNTMTQIKNSQSKDLGIGIAERSANSVKAYYESNSKAIKKYGAELKDLESRYRSIKTEAEKLSLDNEFKNLQTKISAEGLAGKSAFDEFGRAFKQIGQFAWTYGLIQQIPDAISKSVTELKEINTIVTEISKAADVPVKQIKELETSSFSVASKYGQKASDYLLGVQEMTRAGYSDTSGMAELSTLAQSAGDMTAELANQYLIASDMAFGYGGNVEKLNALLDSQNQITNRNAVSLTELANATKIVASQAAQSGVSEDEMTAALSTMIATTQQGGEIAARAFKGILMNLQQVTGELEDGEVIDEDSLQKVEKRLTGVGVAMKEIKDGTVSLRDPMQVLEELAQVYNSLPDNSVEKAGIISDLGGKYRGNQLAALLSNWDKYKKILGDYQNAEGSAAQEAEKTDQSWEGSLNRLSNTWTDLIQNIVDSTSTTNIINFINGIVSGVDTLTEKLGGFKSFLSIVAGGFLTKNGLGKRNAILYKIKQNNRRFINVENFLASNKGEPYSFNY